MQEVIHIFCFNLFFMKQCNRSRTTSKYVCWFCFSHLLVKTVVSCTISMPSIISGKINNIFCNYRLCKANKINAKSCHLPIWNIFYILKFNSFSIKQRTHFHTKYHTKYCNTTKHVCWFCILLYYMSKQRFHTFNGNKFNNLFITMFLIYFPKNSVPIIQTSPA